MKVFPKVMLVIIFIFIVTVSVLEEVITSSSLEMIKEDCLGIESYILDREDLRTAELVRLVDNMEYDWKKNEINMCYLVNHKSIQEVGIELARLRNYIGENEVTEFRASLEVIKYYSESYLHFMGANFHNIL